MKLFISFLLGILVLFSGCMNIKFYALKEYNKKYLGKEVIQAGDTMFIYSSDIKSAIEDIASCYNRRYAIVIPVKDGILVRARQFRNHKVKKFLSEIKL